MQFRQLSNFVRIVDAGSLSKAAGDIRVAQPALTLQISQLEAEIGTQLLIRSSRGVKPTEAGMILYRQARSILRQVQQIPRLVSAHGSDLAGEVTVGLPTGLSWFFSSELVSVVRDRYPHVALQIIETTSAMQRELISEGRISIAVLCEYSHGVGLVRRPLFVQRLALLCDGADSEDREGAPIGLAEAAKRAVVLPSIGSPIRSSYDEAIAGMAVVLPAAVELNSVAMVVNAVQHGIGPALVFWMPLDHLQTRRKLILRPIIDPMLSIQVSLCSSASDPLDASAKAVSTALEEIVHKRIGQPDWPGAIVTDTGP
jgi:LysR family nitrogen assimilation transcriptional regulator